jgi:predicted ATPase/DNA-binding SARP family transcriptional activator
MEIRFLGPLEVDDGGRLLKIPGGRPRALLCLLALNAGRVMQPERLVELMWEDEPPATAANALQVHISALRRAIEPAGPPYRVLLSQSGGYVLNLTPEQIDLSRFERFVQQGHQAIQRGDIDLGRHLLSEAFELWRGSPLEGLGDRPWTFGEARRLEELRVAAEEDRIEVELALGRHQEMIGRLGSLIDQHPLRERFRAQLMIALYRSGRQAEATEVFHQTHRLLVEELGMGPGPELQRTYRAVLNQDPSLLGVSTEVPLTRLDNLPTPTTSFVGRGPELKEIAALLQRVRLVTLTGIGGIGKTRLAIQVARNLLGSYDRGIWIANLAPVSEPNHVPELVASVLDIRPRGGQSVMEALSAALATGRRLLLLDNCEHLVDACAQLVQALLTTAPGLSVLATSRETLGVAGELVWPVPQLMDAVQLFEERAALAAPSFHIEEGMHSGVADLCRRLEGIPLAIELAASRLNTLSMEDLMELTKDRFVALTAGARAASPRHQTLRGAIDWSYNLLSDSEQSLLATLSIFRGSFTLAPATFVHAREDEAEVLELLSGLIRKSLVLVERGGVETRYRLLDTIREYAGDKLARSSFALEVQRHHIIYYCELAERANPQLRGHNAAVWMDRLSADHDNLRAALQSTYEGSDREYFTRLLTAISWFWFLRCFFEEGRRWLQRALTELPPTSPSALIRLLLGAGELAWGQGDHASDGPLFARALELAVQTGDLSLAGQALQDLAIHEQATGDTDAAVQHLERSISLLRVHGPESVLAEALNNLGCTRAVDQGDPEAGAPALEEALTRAREYGDQRVLSLTLDSLASVERMRGRLEEATVLQAEGLRVCRDMGDVWSAPFLLWNMGAILLQRGQAGRTLQLTASSARSQHDVGVVLSPAEQAQFDRLTREARSCLSAEAAAAEWLAGYSLGLDAAIELALSSVVEVARAH